MDSMDLRVFLVGIMFVVTMAIAVYGFVCITNDEIKATSGPEYESGYTEGYAEGYSEHDEDRYSFCKEYISNPNYRNANPRMVGYSKGYVQGYEEYTLL